MASKKVTAVSASAAQDEVLFVGADDGHDSIKICLGYDASSNQFQCSKISSRAAKGIHQVVSLPGGTAISAYETEGQQYTVTGSQALNKSMDTRMSDYPTSDLNRILVAHGLINAGIVNKSVSVVTGLPIDQYYKGDKVNDDLIKAKTASLLKPVKSLGNGSITSSIVAHNCVSEGIGAFYDLLLDGNGSPNEEIAHLIERRPIGFVDLGGKTLDQGVVMENGAGIYRSRCGTSDVGMLAVYDQLAAMLKAKFGLSNDPPQSYVEEAFRTGTYELFGENHDIKDLLKQACDYYVAAIKTELVKKLGDGSDLGMVIFVGGGAAALNNIYGAEAFKQFMRAKIFVPPQPDYANARGYWKAARFLFNDTGSHREAA